MKKTIFTPTEIQRFKLLNEKLLKKEEQIKVFYSQSLKPFHDFLIENETTECIVICQELSVFSNNAICNKRHNAEEGDPIAEINSWFPNNFIEPYSKLGENYNWNELKSLNSEHPLAELHFCYTMHVLAFDTTELEWEDLLEIDDVWMEFKVRYQFHTNRV